MTAAIALTKINACGSDHSILWCTSPRQEVSCATFFLSECSHFLSSSARDRVRPLVRGPIRTRYRCARTSIVCRDAIGDIQAIASSRPMSNAWLLHRVQTPIAVSIRPMLSSGKEDSRADGSSDLQSSMAARKFVEIALKDAENDQAIRLNMREPAAAVERGWRS